MQRIMVLGGPLARAEWCNACAMCDVSEDYVRSDTTIPAILAATLVHEAMHGRLFRWGFQYDGDRRGRIERICFKASIAFARRLPLSEMNSRAVIMQETRSQLDRDPAFWTSESFEARRYEALRQVGIPE